MHRVSKEWIQSILTGNTTARWKNR
uniref:Uncharacterized protein n=1 Tax=mine drainage metagenome TaxID=410659 RepID=E6QIH7_9ZZZZ